ncbi:MAG: hypothetical protein ACUVXA_10285 [Candidatus Jordarchaeum sp.]|uniref:hypothetical protein n=1 Tax=Candidatus Jordarchaeum sp. TaxID=2823881 RepID=UPI00404A8194
MPRKPTFKTVKCLDYRDRVGYSENYKSSFKKILIINSDGLCLVAAGYKNYDNYLISGLLSTIANMGKEILESEIESMSFKGQKFYYIQKGGILFVAHTDEILSEHIVFRILTEIAYAFLEKYGDYLPNWTGNLKTFEEFEKELQKYFDNKRLNWSFNDFLSQHQAKEVILFDLDEYKVLFTTTDNNSLKKYGRAICDFFKSTNNIKLPYKNIETIILKSRNAYIANFIKDEKCLTVVLDQKNYCDLLSLTNAAEYFLEQYPPTRQ